MNQPMFKYSQDNGFSTMNYILAGLCILILLNPIGVSLREQQIGKTKPTAAVLSTKEDNDSDDQNEKIEQSAEF